MTVTRLKDKYQDQLSIDIDPIDCCQHKITINHCGEKFIISAVPESGITVAMEHGKPLVVNQSEYLYGSIWLLSEESAEDLGADTSPAI